MLISDLSHIQKLTLEAVHYFFQNSSSGACVAANLVPYAKRGFHIGLLDAGIQSCNEAALLKWVGQSDDDSVLVLTPDGATLILELFGKDLIQSIENKIPASDRLVSLKDNEGPVSQAQKALDDLVEAVRTANDLTANRSMRMAVLSEVKTARIMLEEPTLREYALVVIKNTIEAIGDFGAKFKSELIVLAAAAAVKAVFVLLGLGG